MKLSVRVVEARNLRAMDLNGFSDPYVRLQLGRHRFRTKVVKKSLNPSWGEEFSFLVEDLADELIVSVMDEDRYFNDDFVGQLKVPVSWVFDAENNSLGTTWHTLLPKNKKSKNRDCGEILLTISLSQKNSFIDQALPFNGDHAPNMEKYADLTMESPSRSFSGSSRSPSQMGTEEATSAKEEKSYAHTFVGRVAQLFYRNGEAVSATNSRGLSMSELLEKPRIEVYENKFEEQSSSSTFEEAMGSMESRDQGGEIPSNLSGGILLDQSYVVAPPDLNSLLFSHDSYFTKSLAELQGTTELQQGPWRFENGGESLKRVVTYISAATKLTKALKANEEQIYLKADGKVFAVLISVSTPDVIYGSTFKTELLFCITPGPELPSGEQSSRLIISWRMNFLQSTMMKGMIEGGARQGLKDSFNQFADLLSQNVKPVDLKGLGSNKEQVLASLQVESQSDWKLAIQYFANFTVVFTVLIGLYVLAHILQAMPSTIQGLEFVGLDLPDSIGEVFVCGILVLQVERVLGFIARFMQARVQKGSDHGVKAQGEGWLLTVALIEGTNLAAVDSSGFSDPYVLFTCNGKTRTSSIKFQKSDPQWNGEPSFIGIDSPVETHEKRFYCWNSIGLAEIFEFDAMDEPPSMMDLEVYDFEGPFDEATSLGHAEINFVKTSIADLADVWIPLQGKLAQACQSRLHLRIFLNDTRGSNVVKEYLIKMEKEVGKKINLRSPQTNSAFQKLFGLPPEEFLINDFTCHLKRKMPLQGRLFLSARIIGFHANLFGHKTKFFFLWEDIEDIQVVAPTLSSMGSPIIVITLRRGRGMDARHGAKTQDEEGRLKFHFQTFVSFNVAHRTITALCKARSLSPEQKMQIVEDESEAKSLQIEENGSFLGLDDVSMSELYSSGLPIPTNCFMELFSGGYLDRKVMEKVGCLSYSYTPWELDKDDVYQRQICYKFDKRISWYRGEVTSTQQRTHLSDRNGWIVEEIMTLHGVPFGDYFNLHLRYQVEPSRSKECSVQVFFGIAWLKSTTHQKRIMKNILSNLQDRLKVIFTVVEQEFIPGK
ncbi:hypothetical protein HHK36_024004 [Tetracentron sinense]|uniref:C2 and GRAM domain-containing protein n=1 Tax=Tetracentron sinense TaxID=13715 RepID=A0A834YR68_TETSI|nr:hypothetical protein HHK36_024004 [Tetracentron sinense]